MIANATQAAALLRGDSQPGEASLTIRPGGFCMCIRSNSQELVERLSAYFRHVLVADCEAEVTIEALESAILEPDVDWVDWPREPGKQGRKDAFIELADGRLLRKVRTGMLFLQSGQALIAAGPCLQYDNQLINFINSQFMNRLQQQGWLICHAAALSVQDSGLAIAGLSGGGKSTLMLALMDHPDVDFVTNDRLFIRHDGARLLAAGIPKMPRINPGTIVHNPRLQPLIEASRREQLLSLPADELWDLEEKHDAMIDTLYGADRVREDTALHSFLVLNWSRDAASPTRLEAVPLAARTDLLPAIMKSPGPFYQRTDGSLLQPATPLEGEPYLDMLRGVEILEATGRVDIPWLADALYTRLSATGEVQGGT